MRRFFSKNKVNAAVLCALTVCAGLASCSLMETDRTDCPEGLYVNFVYNYNTQRADMFKDHVGYVTLYVFDESDRLVMQRNVGNYGEDRPLASYDYRMHFLPGELPDGTYRLMALALQKDWNEALACKGAKYRRTTLQPGDRKQQLRVVLDRNMENSDGLWPVNSAVPLDTLWHGTMLGASEVKVRADSVSYVTISMVRDTKTLNVTIRDIDKPADPRVEDYALTITAPNGRLDCDNNVLPDDTLLYTPYSSWTTVFPDNAADDDPHLQRTAHYDINFNRLMFDGHEDEFATMKLVNLKNGKVIGEFNLARLLAEARTAFELQHYSRQEYLDREYDYRMDFLLKGDRWCYIYITIGVLAWELRIENKELG